MTMVLANTKHYTICFIILIGAAHTSTLEDSHSLSKLNNQNDSFSDFDTIQILDSYREDLTYPGKLIPGCKSFLIEFSKQASKFIMCSVANARPFRFCENCAAHYLKAIQIYNDIKKNDENVDNCRGELLTSDRVQIINSVAHSITDIWTRADCKKCFAVLSEDSNGTVTKDLTAHTKQFVGLYLNFTHCIPENATRGKKNFVHNDTVCADCAHYYNSMNALYSKMRVREDSPQPVCMDIVDMMNYTRLMWGETLRCTITHRDIIPVITITCILLFIPIGFYVGLGVYGTKKHRKVIQDKRLSQFSSSNNYGSNETTPLLSQRYDITASTSSNELLSNNLSECGHIQESADQAHRVINSNKLHNRRTV